MAAPKPYTWEDSEAEVKLLLPVEAGVKGKDVVYTLTPNALTLGIKGQARSAACAQHAGVRDCVRGSPCALVRVSARADDGRPPTAVALCVSAARSRL